MSGDRRLLPKGYPANVTIRGIRFAMSDHVGGMVELLVTHGALDRIEAPAGGGDYLARFKKHREVGTGGQRQVRARQDRR